MGCGESKAERTARERGEAERIAKQDAERRRLEAEEAERKKREWEERQRPFSFTLNSAVRGWMARRDYDKMKAMVARRQKVANEILETERSYVSNLKLCISTFYQPLLLAAAAQIRDFAKDSKRRKTVVKDAKSVQDNIKNYYDDRKARSMSQSENSAKAGEVPEIANLRKEDVKQIFSEIEVIVLYNEQLLTMLEERVASWTWTQQIGPAFTKTLHFLKTYVQYVNNYNASMTKLGQLRADPAFENWLRKQSTKPELKALDVQSFLIMPIQRVPRYVLLVEDLLKCTPEGHIDHDELKTSLADIKKVAIEINEKKAASENFAVLVNYYEKIDPKLDGSQSFTLCEPHRRFVLEGELKQDNKSFMWILFNDCLLKCSENGKRLRLLLHITLRTAKLVDVADNKEKKIKNSFELQTTKHNILITCKSAEDKALWVKSVREQIQAQYDKTESFQKAKVMSKAELDFE